jgi:hypothetical protein
MRPLKLSQQPFRIGFPGAMKRRTIVGRELSEAVGKRVLRSPRLTPDNSLAPLRFADGRHGTDR